MAKEYISYSVFPICTSRASIIQVSTWIFQHWLSISLLLQKIISKRRYASLDDLCKMHNCDFGQDKVLPIPLRCLKVGFIMD